MSQDDDIIELPIPLDRETVSRLARLGRAVGKHPAKAAGELLRDLLRDDEMAHCGLIETTTIQ